MYLFCCVTYCIRYILHAEQQVYTHSTSYPPQLIGLAMIAVGIWLLVRNQDFDFLTNSIYLSPAVLLIVAGVITVVISVVGIVGAVGMWWCVIVVVSRTFFLLRPPSPQRRNFYHPGS